MYIYLLHVYTYTHHRKHQKRRQTRRCAPAIVTRTFNNLTTAITLITPKFLKLNLSLIIMIKNIPSIYIIFLKIQIMKKESKKFSIFWSKKGKFEKKKKIRQIRFLMG